MTEQRTPLRYSTCLPVQSQLTDDMLRYQVPQVSGQWEIRTHNHAPEPHGRSNRVRCTMSGEREGANQTVRVIPGAADGAVGSA